MRYVLVIVAALLAWNPSPADACTRPHQTVFELYEKAAIVIHARVTSLGPVTYKPIATFKGSPGATVKLKMNLANAQSRSTCTPSLQVGRTGVAFVSADGNVVGAYDGFPRATNALLALLKAWSTAATDTARATLLVDLIARVDRNRDPQHVVDIAHDAELEIIDRPELLKLVTTAQRDRLVASYPRDTYQADLLMLLMRLGVTDLDKLAGMKSYAAVMVAAHRFEHVTDPAVLAKLIESTPSGPSAKAVAAYERCERIRGKRLLGTSIRTLAELGTTKHGLDWKWLADACR